MKLDNYTVEPLSVANKLVIISVPLDICTILILYNRRNSIPGKMKLVIHIFYQFFTSFQQLQLGVIVSFEVDGGISLESPILVSAKI